MNIETYRNYCISKKGVTESFPFPNLPNLLVFKVGDKMFTATDVAKFESISLQCSPETIDELRAKYPAITMHKYFSERHWSLVFMNKSIPDKTLLEWIDDSYELALSKLTKKKQAEIRNGG
jgi:predicted DNA-binding protein (MmcQ/YjbR family)